MTASDQRMRVCELMDARGLDAHLLALETCLDERIVDAIRRQQYTPSPAQRRYIAEALQVESGDILWGHAIECEALKDPV